MDALLGISLAHTKLVGGSLRTASHDRQRIKDARDAVAKANKEEAERDAHRSQQRARMWEDE